MAEFSAERDLLESQFAIFNQIVREQGSAFLAKARSEMARLEANGASRIQATRAVVERLVLAQGSDLDRLKESLKAELRRLISQASVGVFQTRLDSLANEAFSFGEPRAQEPGDRDLVWVAVLSSATCAWTPKAAKYELNGKRLTPQNFCRNRHGLRGDSAFWEQRGRPRTGQTVCGANCECTLVPAWFARENPGLLEPVELPGDSDEPAGD